MVMDKLLVNIQGAITKTKAKPSQTIFSNEEVDMGAGLSIAFPQQSTGPENEYQYQQQIR
jgi:hypothetical protein